MKEQVISLLESNRGKSISGSEIAKELQITRAAVWKIITNLRAEGYEIDAITNKGYCLREKNDVISEASIKLSLNTKVLGNQLQVYKTITSTNTLAKELAQAGAQEGLVIISEEQTMGRGRRGRSFYSPAMSGIYMSILLRPILEIDQTLFITVAASVAVAKAIETICKKQVQIKWVNDIFINDKKVCGILTEGAVEFQSQRLEYAILGIGINFSTKKKDFPDEIKDIAGSIMSGDDIKVTRSQLIAEVLNQFEDLYNNINERSFLEYYRSHSSVIGHKVTIVGDVANEVYEAVAIDHEARLVIRDKCGNEKALNSGEVSILKLK